jgi:hypothetical protein
MEIKETLSLEKQSQDLIILLRENVTKKGLFFQKDCYGKAKEDHPKIIPLADTQKILDFYYREDLMTKWDNFRIHEELVEHIQFIHKNRNNTEIFKKHQADVLEFLVNLNAFNNSSVEKISSKYSFWHLNSTIRFWNSLSDIQWNVKEIDYSIFKNYSFDDKGEVKGENINYYCWKLLLYAIDRDISLNKKRLSEDFVNNNPIPLGNLFFGKEKKRKLYYSDLLDKSLNILTSYGFFIREKKKGQEASFHPTLFLKMHANIDAERINIIKDFYDLNNFDFNKFSKNYCNLLDEKHSSEIDMILHKYLNRLIQCIKANFTLSELHLAHKLAEHESGIRLIIKS